MVLLTVAAQSNRDRAKKSAPKARQHFSNDDAFFFLLLPLQDCAFYF
jgi:hypothetical protein